MQISDLTLTDGLAGSASPSPGEGGAIYDAHGSLILQGDVFLTTRPREAMAQSSARMSPSVVRARGAMVPSVAQATGAMARPVRPWSWPGGSRLLFWNRQPDGDQFNVFRRNTPWEGRAAHKQWGNASGGAIDDIGGCLTLTSDTFTLNQSIGGAGGAVRHQRIDRRQRYQWRLRRSAERPTGGLDYSGTSDLNITSGTFTGNSAVGGAGGAGGMGGSAVRLTPHNSTKGTGHAGASANGGYGGNGERVARRTVGRSSIKPTCSTSTRARSHQRALGGAGGVGGNGGSAGMVEPAAQAATGPRAAPAAQPMPAMAVRGRGRAQPRRVAIDHNSDQLQIVSGTFIGNLASE